MRNNIGQFKGHTHGLMKSRVFEIEQKRIVYIFDCVPVSAAYRSFSRKPTTSPTSNVYFVYYNGLASRDQLHVRIPMQL